ncbi:MAG: hypothetical protein PHV95_10955 [Eubacteriales bacterium]|nr:hypothetical protein [Eubacteriales bacterium]
MSGTGDTLTLKLGVQNLYDSYGRPKSTVYDVGGTNQTYNITYKQYSNLSESMNIVHDGVTATKSYTYDKLERLLSTTLTHGATTVLTKNYTYMNGVDTSKTTTLVSSETINGDNFTYQYDNNGNITAVFNSGYYILGYQYDENNQLTYEYNKYSNSIYRYYYDKAGNIVRKEIRNSSDVLLQTINYSYTDANWGDLLTSYNGTAITYDAIGNPLNYRGKSLTWEGRKLSTLTSGSSTYSYKYDESGIRTQKTLTYSGMIGDSRTYYVTDGSKILYEYQQNYPSYTTTNQKYYYYDDNGYLIGFRYNGVDYYYGRNVQGDIIRIYDSTGTVIVYYSYDAWGNILTIGGSLASTVGTANPFRYRGYYYDSETGFYYLNSRYYDPQVGRFISADSVIADVGGEILGNNLFAYCFNNPVNLIDSEGFWPSWGQIFTAAAIIVSAAVAVVAVVATAGAAGAAIGVAAGIYGASAATCATVTSIATVGAYTVAAGIGACSLSNAGEVLTGTNVIRDKVMGGNQVAYDTLQAGLNIAGMGVVQMGQTDNTTVPSKAKEFSPEQKEVVALAKEAKKTGTSINNAQSLVEMGKKVGFDSRIDLGHPSGSNPVTRGVHAHVGPIDHIKIFPE